MSRAVPCPVGARGTDSVQALTAASAAGLRAAGVDFCVRYLGGLRPTERDAILGAGLGLMVVTYAKAWSGPAAVGECRSLGLPAGATVWLDVEACGDTPAADLIARINAWADALAAAGYIPGLYVGPQARLTSAELYALHVVRYWKCGARVQDRFGAFAEPACGWCMYQLYPSLNVGDPKVWSDLDVIQQDFKGRVPTAIFQDPQDPEVSIVS